MVFRYEGAAAADATTVVAPDWLADASADEREELGHLVGAPLREAPDAELAATASQLLAAIRGQSEALERYADAERAEVARIQARYGERKQRLAARVRALEQQLSIVAEGLDYGTKKSRVLGNGTVGFRTVPERLSVLDGAALVAWATTNAPDLIRRETVVKVTVPQAAAKQHLEATGEIPEGCELVPASQKLVYTAEVAS